MPNPLNMPVILTGTPLAEQAHQQVVQQGEFAVRDGIRRMDQTIEQERNEVQELLPGENPEIREKEGGNPKRRRRKKSQAGEPSAGKEQQLEAAEEQGEVEGKGGVIDIKA